MSLDVKVISRSNEKNLLIVNVFDVLREYQCAFDYYSVKLDLLLME